MWNSLTQAAGYVAGISEEENPNREKKPNMTMQEAEIKIEQQDVLIVVLKGHLEDSEKKNEEKQKELVELTENFQHSQIQLKAKISSLTSQLQKEKDKTAKDDIDFDDTSSSDSSERSTRGRVILLKKQLKSMKQQFESQEKESEKMKNDYERRLRVLGEEFRLQEESKSEDDRAATLKDTDASSEQSDPMYVQMDQMIYKDSKILELNNQILEYERQILDLKEHINEKDKVLQSRNLAVQLISADMSRKGKTVVDELEETREEMKNMQSNFVEAELKWKEEITDLKQVIFEMEQNFNGKLQEKDDALQCAKEKIQKLEVTRYELATYNAELQKKVVVIEENSEKDRTELNKKLDDERMALNADIEKQRLELSKLQLSLKESSSQSEPRSRKDRIKERMKIKTLQKELVTLKELPNKNQDPEEVTKLQQKIAVLEEEKGSLQLKLIEIDEQISVQDKLSAENSHLANVVAKLKKQISSLENSLSDLELEKCCWKQKINENEECYNSLKSGFELLKEENAGLITNLEEFEFIRKSLEMKLSALEEQCGHMNLKNCQLSEEISQLKDEKVTSEMRYIEFEEMKERDDKEKATLLDKVKSFEDSYSKDLHSQCKEEKVALEADINILKAQLEDTKKHGCGLIERIDCLEKGTTELDFMLESAKEEIVILSEKNKEYMSRDQKRKMQLVSFCKAMEFLRDKLMMAYSIISESNGNSFVDLWSNHIEKHEELKEILPECESEKKNQRKEKKKSKKRKSLVETLNDCFQQTSHSYSCEVKLIKDSLEKSLIEKASLEADLLKNKKENQQLSMALNERESWIRQLAIDLKITLQDKSSENIKFGFCKELSEPFSGNEPNEENITNELEITVKELLDERQLHKNTINERDNTITKFQSMLDEYESKITLLTDNLVAAKMHLESSEKNEIEITELETTLKELGDTKMRLDDVIGKKDQKISELSSSLNEKDANVKQLIDESKLHLTAAEERKTKIIELEKCVLELAEKKSTMDVMIKEKDQEVAKLTNILNEKESIMKLLTDDLKNTNMLLLAAQDRGEKESQLEVQNLFNENQALVNSIIEKDQKIAELNHIINEKDSNVNKLTENLNILSISEEEKDLKMAEVESILQELIDKKVILDKTIKDKDEKIEQLEHMSREKESKIEQLNEKMKLLLISAEENETKIFEIEQCLLEVNNEKAVLDNISKEKDQTLINLTNALSEKESAIKILTDNLENMNWQFSKALEKEMKTSELETDLLNLNDEKLALANMIKEKDHFIAELNHSIGEKTSVIKDLTENSKLQSASIVEKEVKLTNLETNLQELIDEGVMLSENIKGSDEKIIQLELFLKEKGSKISQLMESVDKVKLQLESADEKKMKFIELEKTCVDLTKEKLALNHAIKAKDLEIAELRSVVSEKESNAIEMAKKIKFQLALIEEKKIKVTEFEKSLQDLLGQNKHAENTIREKDNQIAELKYALNENISNVKKVDEVGKEIDFLKNQLQCTTKIIEKKEAECIEKENSLEKYEKQVEEKMCQNENLCALITELENKLKEKNNFIENLNLKFSSAIQSLKEVNDKDISDKLHHSKKETEILLGNFAQDKESSDISEKQCHMMQKNENSIESTENWATLLAEISAFVESKSNMLSSYETKIEKILKERDSIVNNHSEEVQNLNSELNNIRNQLKKNEEELNGLQ